MPHSLPEVAALTRLVSGRDGADAVTPEAFIGHDNGPADRAGLLALAVEPEVTQLTSRRGAVLRARSGPAGEQRTQRIQDQIVSICELTGDKFALLDIPQSRDIEWVRRWRC